ncbi:MAG TPA: cyclic nucleotide-binding domain-containing protein [Candidatus Limnocylindria bacterium]|nr:cyclic nucleotide-binding domain-containing protein [Candidatus Limnocylindria bacterium]
MRGIDQLLREHPFFVGLDDDTLTLIAGCAANRHLHEGDFLYREGDEAETFFVIRHGRVALEAHQRAGGSLVVETVEDGEVLGWSWLVPPHRWMFDARAVVATSAVVFDGACLRAKCDQDPTLGYALLQRVAQVMLARLQGARVRLLDLYAVPDASKR